MVYWVAAIFLCFLNKKGGMCERDQVPTLNIQITIFYVITKITEKISPYSTLSFHNEARSFKHYHQTFSGFKILPFFILKFM